MASSTRQGLGCPVRTCSTYLSRPLAAVALQDHADMLLCKVAGAVTRKGYLYMVFLKVPVPRLLPSQLVEPVSPQPRGQRLYGNFLGHQNRFILVALLVL